GRRISARHQNWLQVMPGQELKCNGCHDPESELSHGRADAFESVYAGAESTGVPFPGTVASISPDYGETMAEARTRVGCQTDCAAALTPSVDLVYADVWTDPSVRVQDPPLEYRYAGRTTPAPTALGCLSAWTPACRIVIHSEPHIPPIGSVPRITFDDDGVTELENNTCTRSGCHVPRDAMSQTAVPAAQ